jgi:hypothetical protein
MLKTIWKNKKKKEAAWMGHSLSFDVDAHGSVAQVSRAYVSDVGQ